MDYSDGTHVIKALPQRSQPDRPFGYFVENQHGEQALRFPHEFRPHDKPPGLADVVKAQPLVAEGGSAILPRVDDSAGQGQHGNLLVLEAGHTLEMLLHLALLCAFANQAHPEGIVSGSRPPLIASG